MVSACGRGAGGVGGGHRLVFGGTSSIIHRSHLHVPPQKVSLPVDSREGEGSSPLLGKPYALHQGEAGGTVIRGRFAPLPNPQDAPSSSQTGQTEGIGKGDSQRVEFKAADSSPRIPTPQVRSSSDLAVEEAEEDGLDYSPITSGIEEEREVFLPKRQQRHQQHAVKGSSSPRSMTSPGLPRRSRFGVSSGFAGSGSDAALLSLLRNEAAAAEYENDFYWLTQYAHERRRDPRGLEQSLLAASHSKSATFPTDEFVLDSSQTFPFASPSQREAAPATSSSSSSSSTAQDPTVLRGGNGRFNALEVNSPGVTPGRNSQNAVSFIVGGATAGKGVTLNSANEWRTQNGGYGTSRKIVHPYSSIGLERMNESEEEEIS